MNKLNNTPDPLTGIERDPADARAVERSQDASPPVVQPDPQYRGDPSDMDIQEGQERMQADPPPGKRNDTKG
jgi:hypothetical protein